MPLLFLPPWINKYYILDLSEKNSFVKYLVEQGFTVFMTSWKNPDSSMAETKFEDYMTLGPLKAVDVVREITGSEKVNPVGYCIGGALLVMTLAWLAAGDDEEEKQKFGDPTFMVSLQDYSEVREHRDLYGRASVRGNGDADDGAGLPRRPQDGEHVQPLRRAI